jgi:hypothetical protein
VPRRPWTRGGSHQARPYETLGALSARQRANGKSDERGPVWQSSGVRIASFSLATDRLDVTVLGHTPASIAVERSSASDLPRRPQTQARRSRARRGSNETRHAWRFIPL